MLCTLWHHPSKGVRRTRRKQRSQGGKPQRTCDQEKKQLRGPPSLRANRPMRSARINFDISMEFDRFSIHFSASRRFSCFRLEKLVAEVMPMAIPMRAIATATPRIVKLKAKTLRPKS